MSKVEEVGIPHSLFSDKQSVLFHFHEFTRLSAEKGTCVSSRPFSLFNHTWQLELYPAGGHETLEDSDGIVVIGLFKLSKGRIKASARFRLRNGGKGAGNAVSNEIMKTDDFDENEGRVIDFIPHSTISFSLMNVLNMINYVALSLLN